MNNRRKLVIALGASALASHLTSFAQQPERVRRIGALINLAEGDQESKIQVAAFVRGLQELGWTVGRNVVIDYRWTEGNADRVRKYAAELVSLSPDVLLTTGGSHVGPLQQATRSVPIVFIQTADPVGGGFVESLARPGGNTTGFTVFEFDIGAKWLELLKEIAPRVKRVAVLRDPTNPSGTGLMGAIQAVAPSLGVEVSSPVGLRDTGEIERGVAAFARLENGGLIVTPASFALVHRDLIIKLAAQHRLPTIYPFRLFANDGGLLSYGPDVVDQYWRAAGYVNRILKGEMAANLAVQRSTKLDLVINLRTAKALGLPIPQALLLRAVEVIQ
jgi:putative tryptophan/tyrosine transport system substrate-binding protein